MAKPAGLPYYAAPLLNGMTRKETDTGSVVNTFAYSFVEMTQTRARHSRVVAAAVGLAAIVGCGATPVTDSIARCERPSLPPRATASELKAFEYDKSLPLNLDVSAAREQSGVRVHDVAYDSPKGGRVTGLLFVPAATGPHAGIIVQHGLPGSASGVAGDATLFASHGAVVLAIDAPFARRTGSPISFASRDSAEQVQLMVDLQRGIDVLLSRDDVDSGRLAYRGWSYGGAMGALFVAIERRLKTAILTVPDGGLVSHFTGDDDTNGPLGSLACADQLRWLRAMQPLEPLRFVHLASPTPLLFQGGRLDNLVPPKDFETVSNAASEPKQIKWYDAGHGLTSEAIRDQLEWLHTHVGTSSP
jgi:cephalosporin-C deacetylase-like acetyl esterase